MLNWLFPRRRARNAHVEACIAGLLEEAAWSSQTITLTQAAMRLQGRARSGGVLLGFDQALYRLRERDRDQVFVRGR